MPFLRSFDKPIFDTFGEAIECIRQLFEVRFSYSVRKHFCMKIASHIGTFWFYLLSKPAQL